MSLPSPDDPADAPIWENFIVAQAAQAALGLIPRHAIAVGVRVNGTDVELTVQLSERDQRDGDDIDDIDDIVSELEALVGPAVNVSAYHEVRDSRAGTPSGSPIRWVYLARPDTE